jgi:5-methyltetrahydrofolate--homocysteine methyltransferase
MTVLADIARAVIDGDHVRVGELARRAIADAVAPKTILDDGLIAGMTVVGDRFRDHEIFLPDVLLAARAMYAGMDELRPLLIRDGIPSIGKVVIGTVRGDLHDIGKNLVGIMLKGAGFEVIDLGNDVAPARMVDTAVEHGAAVIGMSALLTTTMPAMAEVVTLLKERNLDGKVRTIIGGAPVDEAFARRIGADAYGFDAGNAVDVVKRLIAAH